MFSKPLSLRTVFVFLEDKQNNKSDGVDIPWIYLFLAIVYRFFRSYLLCFGVFLQYLQVHKCFGDIWWFWSILEIKLEENHSYPSNQSRVDIQSQTSIDIQLLSSFDSEARKVRLGSQPTYGPSSTSFIRIPVADFNLIFMCSAIVLGNTRFHAFYFSQKNIFRVFSSLERRSKTHSELCIGTPVFLPYSIYAFNSDICYVLLCYVWVVTFVRLRVRSKVMRDYMLRW